MLVRKSSGGGAGDFKANGSVTMTGPLSTYVGTFSSAVANGVAAKGFAYNTPAYTTTAKLASWANNNSEVAYLQQDGRWKGKEYLLADVYIGQRTTSNLLFDVYTSGGVAMAEIQGGGGGLFLNSAQCPMFGVGNSTVNSADVALYRAGAGLWRITDGGTTNKRDLELRDIHASGVIKSAVYTVAKLPSAATSGNGARAHVSDAFEPTFGATVATGGAVSTPVYSDGTNWKVG